MRFTLILLATLLLAACQTPAQPDPTALPTDEPTAVAEPTDEPSAAPTDAPAETDESTAETAAEPTAESDISAETMTLTVLYTNDEHGWMEGVEPEASAAHLLGLWQSAEMPASDHTLILSGGDMWTGPAISTWFEGESMAEVMNAMGYQAAAVGNHEFDFGLEVLRDRAEQSDFPFLSANIRKKSDGSAPTEWGIEPYTLVEVGDLTVGLIGLTTPDTATTTNPANVADFDFIDPAAALQEVVPQVEAAGADLILVPGHLCQNELRDLASAVADLNVALIGGGHCNELFAEEQNGIVLTVGGGSMASYARVVFTLDAVTGDVLDVAYDTVANSGGSAEATVASLIEKWQTRTTDELAVEIGYTDTGLRRQGEQMQTWVVGSWLDQTPTADVAITNLGGFRADLEPGPVSLGTIITVLPFSNVIVDLELTGEQLLDVLIFAQSDAAIAGVHQAGVRWILDETGESIDPDETYSVLVNDFMFAGGDGYDMLAEFDPDGYNTTIDWRQPVIDWTIEQQTSAEMPLEAAIRALE